jgi:hypothetical protein
MACCAALAALRPPGAPGLDSEAGVARFAFRTRVRVYRQSLAEHRARTGRPAAETRVPLLALRRPGASADGV